MGPPLRLIFYRGYSLFLKNYEENKQSTVFWPFQLKNALILTTSGFYGHGEFNDDIYNLCTTTQGCYARPRRHQDRVPIGARCR